MPMVLLQSDEANVSFLHPENGIDGESRPRDEDELTGGDILVVFFD